MSNAMKFRRQRMEVKISGEADLLISVEDDGIGMDEATCEKIFTQYFSTKGTDGTGLGLMVVHEIVKEHGGRIEVLSAPGKGSSFRIILPLQQLKGLLRSS